MTYINPFKPDYGDGSDGAYTSGNLTVAKSEYQWSGDVTLDAAHTVTLHTDYKPSIWRCTGTMTIKGTFDGVGKGYDGGARVVSGGGPASNAGADGTGLEKGLGVWAAPGSKPLNSLNKLGDLLLQSYGVYWVGSGSASGGCNGTDGGAYGGDGSKGGGTLILVALDIVIESTAVINMSGATGNNGSRPNSTGTAYGSCGGAAGDIVLVARTITLPDSGDVLVAVGGAAGQDSPAATTAEAGADGHIYLVYTGSYSGSLEDRANPNAVAINLKALPIGLG